MAEKKTQIGFRVTEAVRKQIEVECIERGLSVQELLIASFEYYRGTPKNWDYSASTFVRVKDETSDEVLAERMSWTKLWLAYIDNMPREKILMFAEAMRLDLQHYKSSRRKR